MASSFFVEPSPGRYPKHSAWQASVRCFDQEVGREFRRDLAVFPGTGVQDHGLADSVDPAAPGAEVDSVNGTRSEEPGADTGRSSPGRAGLPGHPFE